MVEIAIVAPLLLVLVLTAMNVGIYVSDMLNAGTASRQAARLAALLGGGKHVTPTPQTSAYDAQIVQAVQASAGSMPYASVTEIDIYQPSTNSDGSYSPPSDPADEYNGDGSARSKQTFPLTSRSQSLPGETPIGVRVVWRFRPPTGLGFPSLTANQYTVFRALAVP
ncbi:MAG: pilus assembly protein [Candidatus Dormibacteraeota bacterium]|nr:pilus assembly protein [Candidatus Dormibacteraeota bacterium]MDQ6920311.1 pilus assembly protein [Candidatus Dormibacteraeota bacterium]